LLACGVARWVDDALIEIFPNAQEVADGGMISISMRVPVRCPACAAPTAAGSCSRCGGRGKVDEPFSAWLALRPGVGDGTLLLPSALLDGMVHRLSFRVRLDGGG
jgi:hypothetical protein